MKNDLKIYQFDFGGAKDWIIAKTKKRAIYLHQSETGMHISEYEDVKITRVLKKNWDNYTYFKDDPKNTITFREFMKNECFEERLVL